MGGLVAIGFAEALSAPEVAWSLLDAGFDVVAIGRKGQRSSALDQSRHVSVRKITAPEKSATAAGNELVALLSEIGAAHNTNKVFLPLDDATLWLGSQISLPRGWNFAGPSFQQTELALDKERQIIAARTAGFLVPESAFVRRHEDLENLSQPFPILLRPSRAVSESHGRIRKGSNWICANKGELDKVAKRWDGDQTLLSQPYLEGVGVGLFGLATAKGVVGWSSHRRQRMMNPHGSGSSACISQPVPAGLTERAEQFIASTNWRGLFMIELLERRGDHLLCGIQRTKLG